MFNREVDLYPAVIEHFTRYTNISAEVPHGKASIDLVFSSDQYRTIIAVEVKRSKSWSAIKQAVHAQQFANYAFVALPRDSAMYAIDRYQSVLETTGIGVIAVSKTCTSTLIKPQRSSRICKSARAQARNLLIETRNHKPVGLDPAIELIHGARHAAKLLSICNFT